EGLEERKDSANNSKILSFNGKNKGVSELIREEFVKNGGSKTGAKLHANSIAYDGRNKEHRKMIKGIESAMKEKHSSDTRTAEQIASKLANFTIHGQGTQDSEELNAFQRMTKKTKDTAGNVMFNISNAKEEAKDKTLGMMTLKGMTKGKSEEGVEKQSKVFNEELRNLEDLDFEELESSLKNTSMVGILFTTRNKVKEDLGNQKHSADIIGKSNKSFGAGVMFGKLDTKDDTVREHIAKSGII